MVEIFEKYVEKTDIDRQLRFPHDANIIHLPTDQCSNEGRWSLKVKDENGDPWTLTIENRNGQIYFIKGWKEFREAKGITVGDKISLYKYDDYVGSEAQYSIKVTKAKKRDG